MTLQVGATAFVGLLEGTGGISYNVMLKTTFGWVFTLIAVGIMSALMMVLGIRTPNVRNSSSLNAIEHSVVLGGHEAAADIASRCPKSPALEVCLSAYLCTSCRTGQNLEPVRYSLFQVAYTPHASCICIGKRGNVVSICAFW